MTVPTQDGFVAFLQGVAAFDPLVLPSNAPVISDAYGYAVAAVDPLLANLSGNLYSLAIYNLGTDYVVNYAPDQVVSGVARTFFSDLRTQLGINTFVPGVVASSGNSPTNQSTLNPEFMKTFTMMDLQTLKTPWGRAYMAIAQQSSTIWGVS